MPQMGGAVMAKSYCLWDICSKNPDLQGSTLSGHCMNTGFSPTELLTGGLLQKGQDHSPPQACFNEEPSSQFGIHTAMNILTKQIGGGLNGWSYQNINQ